MTMDFDEVREGAVDLAEDTGELMARAAGKLGTGATNLKGEHIAKLGEGLVHVDAVGVAYLDILKSLVSVAAAFGETLTEPEVAQNTASFISELMMQAGATIHSLRPVVETAIKDGGEVIAKRMEEAQPDVKQYFDATLDSVPELRQQELKLRVKMVGNAIARFKEVID